MNFRLLLICTQLFGWILEVDIGTMTGVFNSWIYSTYGIESATMEFSDHVWTPELHTSVAMSVAVNMYLNQIIQHICARFKTITPKVESTDIYPAKG